MLTPPLSEVEVRILGALIEKAVTTPDLYPLSMSALIAACNQLTSRDPVMRLEESAVAEAIVTLRRRGLLRAIQPAGSRVTKYMHLLDEALSLDVRELAVLGVLMLRGQQTAGELHQRTARLADFAGIPEVEATLERLIARAPEALVARLPRRAGQKEGRFAHRMSGEPAMPEGPDGGGETGTAEGAAPSAASEGRDAALAALEQAVHELRSELASLRAQFDEFRAQFQ